MSLVGLLPALCALKIIIFFLNFQNSEKGNSCTCKLSHCVTFMLPMSHAALGNFKEMYLNTPPEFSDLLQDLNSLKRTSVSAIWAPLLSKSKHAA